MHVRNPLIAATPGAETCGVILGAGEMFEGTGIELNQHRHHEATGEVVGRYDCKRTLFSHSVRLLSGCIWENIRPLLSYCWAPAISSCRGK